MKKTEISEKGAELLTREQMKDVTGGVLQQPQLYVCNTSSGDTWGVYGTSRSDAMGKCQSMIEAACKTPNDPPLMGPF